MQHTDGDGRHKSMAAETGTEQWRVELAELLARVEAEGRELTVEEVREIAAISPPDVAKKFKDALTTRLH